MVRIVPGKCNDLAIINYSALRRQALRLWHFLTAAALIMDFEHWFGEMKVILGIRTIKLEATLLFRNQGQRRVRHGEHESGFPPPRSHGLCRPYTPDETLSGQTRSKEDGPHLDRVRLKPNLAQRCTVVWSSGTGRHEIVYISPNKRPDMGYAGPVETLISVGRSVKQVLWTGLSDFELCLNEVVVWPRVSDSLKTGTFIESLLT